MTDVNDRLNYLEKFFDDSQKKLVIPEKEIEKLSTYLKNHTDKEGKFNFEDISKLIADANRSSNRNIEP